MIKKLYIMIIVLVGLLSYGQHTTFEPNINPDALELKQTLSEDGGSLLLESEKVIRQVDIINENFFKTIHVDSNKTEIDFNKLPIGKFILKARLGKKRIVMYLERHEKNGFIMTLPNSNKPRSDKAINDKNDLYWVVYQTETNFGSFKSMSLEYSEKVSYLISKNKLDIKSDIAKNNRLFIYEIYNRSQFMTNQLRNRDYYKSKTSDVFNVIPIYSSSSAHNRNVSF